MISQVPSRRSPSNATLLSLIAVIFLVLGGGVLMKVMLFFNPTCSRMQCKLSSVAAQERHVPIPLLHTRAGEIIFVTVREPRCMAAGVFGSRLQSPQGLRRLLLLSCSHPAPPNWTAGMTVAWRAGPWAPRYQPRAR